MKIVWVGHDQCHSEWFRVLSKANVKHIAVCQEEDADVFVVSAAGGSVARASYAGLQWLQRTRRCGALAPAVVYAFESRTLLAHKVAILRIGSPGIGFIRLPFSAIELENLIKSLHPLSPQELRQVIRWGCGLQEECRGYVHSIASLLGDWPESSNAIKRIVSEWGLAIRKEAEDQIAALDHLEAAIGCSPERIREALQTLEEGLCRPPAPESFRSDGDEVADPIPGCPPPGFSALAIADDQGYEVSAIERFRQLGYAIGGPARSLAEAFALLEYWCPHVVLVDLNFPSRAEGDELIRRALSTPSVRLVIAASRASAEPASLPREVEDSCGPSHYQDAMRIHQIIWRRARHAGVVDVEGAESS